MNGDGNIPRDGIGMRWDGKFSWRWEWKIGLRIISFTTLSVEYKYLFVNLKFNRNQKMSTYA
jgi:hypothetical protein